MAREFKVGDEIQVLNDRAVLMLMQDPKADVPLKTVKVSEVIKDEQGVTTHVKFESGFIRHQDGTEEPYYLTYPLERVV